MMTKDRLHLIDVLKLMTLMAIAILHVNEFVFYSDKFPLGNTSPFWWMWSYYARVFTIGGQILVAIIYFLFGYSGKSKKSLILISLFAIIGQASLALVFQTLEWDIYSYLGVSNLLIVAIPFFYKKNQAALILSFMFLLIPTWLFKHYSPDSSFFVILTGKMSEYNTGSWPLVPWFFLALLFYQAGLFSRNNDTLKVMTTREKILWSITGVASLPFFGAYYWVPIGPHYYDFTFNQLPHIFWANFWIFVFIIRLSLLKSVQDKINGIGVIQWISKLYWIRHMGLTYLLSIIYLGIGMRLSETFQKEPLFFDVFFALLMPACELAARFSVFMVKYFKHERVS
jgi:hypothetical protein